MVEDILKAATAYRNLSPIGKRLFREETGLNSTKRRAGGRRRRRTATKAKTGIIDAPRTLRIKRATAIETATPASVGS
jgi:hypothetical protein